MDDRFSYYRIVLQLVLTEVQRQFLFKEATDKKPNESCALLFGKKENEKLIVREKRRIPKARFDFRKRLTGIKTGGDETLLNLRRRGFSCMAFPKKTAFLKVIVTSTCARRCHLQRGDMP